VAVDSPSKRGLEIFLLALLGNFGLQKVNFASRGTLMLDLLGFLHRWKNF